MLHRSRRGWFPLLAVATLAVNACGSDDTSTTERQFGIYAAVIRAIAAEDPPEPSDDDGEPIIYAGPLDEETSIPLEVQAAVVEDLEDLGTIRFVDERSEAVDDEEVDEPVLDDGTLMLLGPIPDGPAPTVQAERYETLDDMVRFSATAERSSGEWSATLAPSSPG